MRTFVPRYVLPFLMAGTLGVCPFADVAHASPDLAISLKDFGGESAAGFTMSGDAALDGARIRLTRAEAALAGSAIYSEPVELARDKSFSAYFTFSITPLGDPDKPAADGVAFILHNDTKNLGGNGEGLGYRGIFSSVAVEFDTFQNGGESDPNPNHVGIDVNGDMKSVAAAVVSQPLADGTTRHAWVEYDGSTKKLEVRVAASATRPAQPLLSHTIDLGNVLQDSPHVGFSAGTGAFNEEHHIESFYFVGNYLRDGIDPPKE